MDRTKKLKIFVLPERYICNANDYISSVAGRFTNTHTPLFAYLSNKSFAGLLTIENALFHRSYNPVTLIQSRLMKAPYITPDSTPHTVLKIMRDLRLYTLPVFNRNHEILGVTTAKGLLAELTDNLFVLQKLETMKLGRPAITISYDETVGTAFHIFNKQGISRLIVLGKKNKAVGIVTKRDILSFYLTPTSKQRFSTRGSPKNYSFDIEKTKRDDSPIETFTNPIHNTIFEQTHIEKVIQRLIESKYNSIVLIDDSAHPTKVITTRDIVKAMVSVTAKTPSIPVIISQLPHTLDDSIRDKTRKELKKFIGWFSKQQTIQKLRLSTKLVLSPEGKINIYETRLKIHTDKTSYFAKSKNRVFLQALLASIRQIKKQIRRT